jgi:hypothetical protein
VEIQKYLNVATIDLNHQWGLSNQTCTATFLNDPDP